MDHHERGSYWYYRTRWRAGMLRAYALGLTALAVFAIAYALRHHHTLQVAAKVLAGVVGFACVALGALSTSYAIRASRVRRREEMRRD